MIQINIFGVRDRQALLLEQRLTRIAIELSVFAGIRHIENVDHFIIYGVEKIPSIMIEEGEVHEAECCSDEFLRELLGKYQHPPQNEYNPQLTK